MDEAWGGGGEGGCGVAEEPSPSKKQVHHTHISSLYMNKIYNLLQLKKIHLPFPLEYEWQDSSLKIQLTARTKYYFSLIISVLKYLPSIPNLGGM